MKGIRTLALTTNAYKMDQEVAEYRLAGITNLNVSVDSLDPENFRTLNCLNTFIKRKIETVARNSGFGDDTTRGLE